MLRHYLLMFDRLSPIKHHQTMLLKTLDVFNIRPTPSNFVGWDNQSNSRYFEHVILFMFIFSTCSTKVINIPHVKKQEMHVDT